MRETLASAGDGPVAIQASEKPQISSADRVRAALAACESLMADCARVAGDREETSAAQMLAAATASKLAAASAQAACAIARLADAETHQRLADAKIELAQRPAPRRIARPVARPDDDYGSNDWRAYRDEMDSPKPIPANNPRIRYP